MLAMSASDLDVNVLIFIAGIGAICIALCAGALVQARKGRDLNFKHSETVNRLTEKVTTMDFRLSRMELTISQIQARQDEDFMQRLRDTIANPTPTPPAEK